MRRNRTGLLVLLLLMLLAGVVGAEPRAVIPERVQVEDADTLKIEVGGVAYRIQLPGIDAPEDSANPKLQRDLIRTGLGAERLLALGQAASAGLRTLLERFEPYRLRFDPAALDKYGRVPGDLFDAQGQALSERLVGLGYAVALPSAESERAAHLARAAAEARDAGAGLWASDAEGFAAWARPAPAGF